MRRSWRVLVAVAVLAASCSSGSGRPARTVTTTVADWFTTNAVVLQAWSDASARAGVLLTPVSASTMRGAQELYVACRAWQSASRELGALTPTADGPTDAALRSTVEQGVQAATACLSAVSVWPSDRAKLDAARAGHEAAVLARQQAESRAAVRVGADATSGRVADAPPAESAASVCADLARVRVEVEWGSRPDPAAGASGARRFFVQAQVRSAAHRPALVVVNGHLVDPRTGDATGGTASGVVAAGGRVLVVVKGFGLRSSSQDPGLRWDGRSYAVRQDGLSWDGRRCRAQP